MIGRDFSDVVPEGLLFALGRRFLAEVLHEGRIPECQSSAKEIVFSYGPHELFEVTVTFAWLEDGREPERYERLYPRGKIKASYRLQQLFEVDGRTEGFTVLEVDYHQMSDHSLPSQLEVRHYAKPPHGIEGPHPQSLDDCSYYLMLNYFNTVLNGALFRDERLAAIIKDVEMRSYLVLCPADPANRGGASWTYSDLAVTAE